MLAKIDVLLWYAKMARKLAEELEADAETLLKQRDPLGIGECQLTGKEF